MFLLAETKEFQEQFDNSMRENERERERDQLMKSVPGTRMKKNELILFNYSTKMDYIYNPKTCRKYNMQMAT